MLSISHAFSSLEGTHMTPQTLAHPKFIDHHKYDVGGGYIATNEEHGLFTELIGKQKFDRMACIASGGEFLLQFGLKRAKEVVGVDHAYTSLAVTYLKLLLFQEGIKPLKEDLRKEDYAAITALFTKVFNELPAVLQTSKCKEFLISRNNLSALRSEWYYNKVPNIITKASVAKVTLVHGDLSDLPQLFKPFDLFYASNALEHSGRDYKHPTMQILADLVVPGGILLLTTSRYTAKDGDTDKYFKFIGSISGYRTNYGWKYVAYSRK